MLPRVFRNTAIYAGVTVLQSAGNFILLPLYTRHMAAGEYGVVSVVLAITNFLSMLYGLSLRASIVRFHHKYSQDGGKVARMWGACLTFVLASSFLLTTVLFVTRRFSLMPFLGTVSFFPFMAIALVSVTLNPSYQLFQASLQTRQLGGRFALNNIVFFVLNATLGVFFVTGLHMKAEGVLLASAVTNVVFFIITMVRFVPEVRLGFHGPELREALAYSVPLVPHSISVWAIAVIDKIFMNRLVSTAGAGLFDVGYQMGNLISILIYAVNLAFSPWYFEQWRMGQEGRARIARAATSIVIPYGVATMALSLFSYEIVSVFMGPGYSSAWQVTVLIAFAYAFNGTYTTCGVALYIHKTYLLPFITLISAVVKIAASLLLIPRFGMLGAGASTLVAMVITSVVTFLVSQRVERLPYRPVILFGVPAVLFGISAGVSLLQWRIGEFSPWLLAAKAAILVVIGGGMLGLELKNLKALFLKRPRAAGTETPSGEPPGQQG